jgi:hypothetical protein
MNALDFFVAGCLETMVLENRRHMTERTESVKASCWDRDREREREI